MGKKQIRIINSCGDCDHCGEWDYDIVSEKYRFTCEHPKTSSKEKFTLLPYTIQSFCPLEDAND
jgi:hypothetical protein